MRNFFFREQPGAGTKEMTQYDSGLFYRREDFTNSGDN